MNTVTAQHASLQIDDYLDLLNFDKKVEDLKWQKEIIRKLERMNDSSFPSKGYPYEDKHIKHL